MARARQTIDPNGTGFDALMMATDDGDFFGVTYTNLQNHLRYDRTRQCHDASL
jgi:hypothetical protein